MKNYTKDYNYRFVYGLQYANGIKEITVKNDYSMSFEKCKKDIDDYISICIERNYIIVSVSITEVTI